MNNVLRSSNCDVDTIILMGGSTKNPLLMELLEKDYPGFKINRSLDPDESVAKGAGIKARNYMYGDNDVQVFDILPQQIGILSGDKVLPLIRQNSQLPTSAEMLFTTTEDDQETVRVRIFQGNSRYPEECVELGGIAISGIKKAPKGVPDLGIQLTINADCMLTCKAAIDGVFKEVKLNLNSVDRKKSLAEDPRILRWHRSIKKLPEDVREEIEGMLEKYPSVYSAKDIGDAIRKYVDLDLRGKDAGRR